MIKYIITRAHFSPSHHPQNSMNFPNYTRDQAIFSNSSLHTDEKKDFFSKFIKISNIGILAFLSFEKNVIVKRLRYTLINRSQEFVSKT